jgi:hypothetical protein
MWLLQTFRDYTLKGYWNTVLPVIKSDSSIFCEFLKGPLCSHFPICYFSSRSIFSNICHKRDSSIFSDLSLKLSSVFSNLSFWETLKVHDVWHVTGLAAASPTSAWTWPASREDKALFPGMGPWTGCPVAQVGPLPRHGTMGGISCSSGRFPTQAWDLGQDVL